MKLYYLSNKFYQWAVDNIVEIEHKNDRPYAMICIKVNNHIFAIPLRSNISHPNCYITEEIRSKIFNLTGENSPIYHLIMCIKYRKKVLDDVISDRLRAIFEKICENYNIILVDWEHDIDHIHCLIEGHPNTEMSKFINAYKSAMGVKAIIGDINDFESPDKLVAYVGLCPRVNNSNETVNHGRITKRGNKLVRKLLVQCAWVSVRYNPTLKDFYTVLKKRKPAGKAIIAVARKLVYQIFYTLKYNWYFTNTANTEKIIKVF